MNKKDVLISVMLSLFIIGYLYLIMILPEFNSINYSILGIVILMGIFITLSSFKNVDGIKNKDKLFNLFINSSDTVYIVLNAKDKKLVYISDNVEKILNINTNNISKEEVLLNILNIPILKNELNNWDKNSYYVSQMLEYHNKKDIWLKIKLNNQKYLKEEYYIIELIDSTKEHDRQHMLITQASSIKTREAQLNEITAASYDVEMNIDLMNNKYELKYFKSDMKYFGEEDKGIYTEKLQEIVSNYINKNDSENLYNVLSLDSLKENFARFEINTKTIRYRVGNEDKNNIWLESTIFYLSNRNNHKVSVLTKNVTESAESIREQNVMLQNALNEAKKLDSTKDELIKTISHDIRTPLTNIMGLSESILTKKLDNEIKEDVKNINDSSHEMLDIIDSMINFKNINVKDDSAYNIFKVFAKIINNEKEYAQNKNINLNLNMDTNLPVVLSGDHKKIVNIVTELVDNAIKYTNEGKVNVNVRGTKKNDTVDLIVVVKDTGEGIEPKLLDKIMKEKSDTGYDKIKSLVEALGGIFEIESKVGEFTRVTLTINQKIIEDNKIREKLEKNKNAETFDLKGKKVLVVDDNKLNLKVTNKLLEKFNLDITLITNGKEAIDLIEKDNDYDLILMDQMMPGLSGTDVLKELKSKEDFKIPVVVLTADAIEGQKEKYLSEGFDDYISKPIDKGELSIVLKRFLK